VVPSPVYKSVDRYFQFSLLGLVASGFFALANTGRLDTATIAFTSAALLLRALVLAGWLRIHIPQGVVAAAVGYVLFYPIDFLWISRDFFAATVHGVCFLAALKILTGRTDRDLPYTCLVAFVEVVAAALLSWQPSFIIWIALCLFFSVAVFTSGEIRSSLSKTPGLKAPATGVAWRLGTVAVISLVSMLVLTGGFFVFVPRTARAAAILFPGASRITGFSGIVDLGTFGAIAKDDRAVAHILSRGRPLPLNMKWRGATLSRFDGRRWFEPVPSRPQRVATEDGTATVAPVEQLSRRDGRRLLYRVDSTASTNGTLFIAGIPEYLRVTAPQLVRRSGNTWQALPPTNEALRYEVSSFLADPLPEPLGERDRLRYLALPPVDARIFPLAREWAGEGSILDRSLRIQDHLRRDYRYTLNTPVRPVRDPLARFLFEERQGYCEYFASAMAVMLRSLGVPARVVTGFQSGYFNTVSNLTVLRASDAHAWVEGWFPDRGWVTFDPTPSTLATESGLLGRFNMYLDAADSVWQQWVVAYDLGRQALLAARLGAFLSSGRPSASTEAFADVPGLLRANAIPIAAILALTLLLWNSRRIYGRVSGWALLHRVSAGTASPHDASRLYELMLKKVGGVKPSHMTPATFAATVPEPVRLQVLAFTDRYYEARYGGEPKAVADLAEMLRRWA
jgi:transglutaminase-like putative cysteine protease